MKQPNKRAFAQPECRVVRIHTGNVISTSPSAQNEEYETGDTSNWF